MHLRKDQAGGEARAAVHRPTLRMFSRPSSATVTMRASGTTSRSHSGRMAPTCSTRTHTHTGGEEQREGGGWCGGGRKQRRQMRLSPSSFVRVVGVKCVVRVVHAVRVVCMVGGLPKDNSLRQAYKQADLCMGRGGFSCLPRQVQGRKKAPHPVLPPPPPTHRAHCFPPTVCSSSLTSTR